MREAQFAVQTYHGWRRKYGGMEVDEARHLRVRKEENRRLKRLVADQAVQIHYLERGERKKMVSPSRRRRALKIVVEERKAAQRKPAVRLDWRDRATTIRVW